MKDADSKLEKRITMLQDEFTQYQQEAHLDRMNVERVLRNTIEDLLVMEREIDRRLSRIKERIIDIEKWINSCRGIILRKKEEKDGQDKTVNDETVE